MSTVRSLRVPQAWAIFSVAMDARRELCLRAAAEVATYYTPERMDRLRDALDRYERALSDLENYQNKEQSHG